MWKPTHRPVLITNKKFWLQPYFETCKLSGPLFLSCFRYLRTNLSNGQRSYFIHYVYILKFYLRWNSVVGKFVENWEREDPFSVHTCTLYLYVQMEEINVTQMTTIPVNCRKHCRIWRKWLTQVCWKLGAWRPILCPYLYAVFVCADGGN